MLNLGSAPLSPEALAAAATGPVEIAPDPAGLARMAATRRLIDEAIAQNRQIYGVTTGLGARVGEALDAGKLSEVSLATIRGRAHAVGPEEKAETVRAAMIVRLHTLLSGHAAASPSIAEHLRACLNVRLTPVTPSLGSVGVADLTWNATMALALIGEGRMVDRNGVVGPSGAMMATNGIVVPVLGPRDGLALVSNSCAVAGAAALALTAAAASYEAAQSAAALSLEAFGANLTAFDANVLAVKPQQGQDSAAAGIRSRLARSRLLDPAQARRLQDPVSFRNIPQIHGTVAAALAFARGAVVAEINGASDNPVALPEAGRIVSSGVYFTSELTNAAETLSRSFVHLTFSQLARMAKLLDPAFSGLPLFLAEPGTGTNGFAPLLKTAEALAAELAHEAQPVAVWPSLNANGVEDCLSSAPVAVRALGRIADLSSRLTAIELMVAARAVEQRAVGHYLGPVMAKIFKAVRERSGAAIDDRPLGADVEALAGQIRTGAFA
jgi:histidine ammonia-lyase